MDEAKGIIVDLGQQRKFNKIWVLPFHQFYKYSYVINVSMDKKVWTSVVQVEHTGYQESQTHEFQTVNAQYIRIHGSRVNYAFVSCSLCIVSLKAYLRLNCNEEIYNIV